MYKSGNYTNDEIAKKFSIHPDNIHKIVKERSKVTNDTSLRSLSNELTEDEQDVNVETYPGPPMPKPIDNSDDDFDDFDNLEDEVDFEDDELKEMLEDMLYFQRGDNMKNIQYIVDDKGKKIAVIMPIEEYERLLEDIHDLSIAKERINEPEEDLDDVIEELKNEGLLPHSYKTLSQERTKKNR